MSEYNYDLLQCKIAAVDDAASLLDIVWGDAMYHENMCVLTEVGDGRTSIPSRMFLFDAFVGNFKELRWTEANHEINRMYTWAILSRSEMWICQWEREATVKESIIYRHFVNYRDALKDLYELLTFVIEN
jgi:hypothetical protein